MKEKIRTIMHKRGTATIFIVVLALLGFFAVRSFAGWTRNPDDPKQKLLYYIAMIIQNGHYQPKDINDEFSSKIFSQYINNIDSRHDIFLSTDIELFLKHEKNLDDEMLNNKNIEFVPLLANILTKRVKEADSFRKKILRERFDFSKDESYTPIDHEEVFSSEIDPSEKYKKIEVKDFPIHNEAKEDLWRRRLKMDVIEIFYNAKKQEIEKRKDTAYKKWVSFDSLELETRQNISSRYDRFFNRIYKHFGEKEQFERYFATIMSVTDPHSTYLSPVDTRSYEENTSGKFYGIGALLTSDGNHVKIASISPGGSAWKSKLIHKNDLILKVAQGDGDSAVDIVGYEVTEAVKIIRGDKGTKVRLTIQKTDGKIMEVSMIRDKIFINQTFARSGIIPYQGKKMGYIYLPEFYNSMEKADNPQSSLDVRAELEKLKSEKVEGVILDLRDNGGGFLMDAIRMAGWFIPQGPIVQVKNRDEEASPLLDIDSSVVYSGPLVILINEYSASASEILAAAMQDYKRALIVGAQSSFGKGTVQRGGLPVGAVFGDNSKDYGTVNLTIQKFYRINGQSTQLKGVQSDIVLPSLNDFLPTKEKDLPFAIPYDTVKGAEYSIYNPSNSKFLQTQKKVKTLVDRSSYYQHINKYGSYIAEQRNKPIPLEWNSFEKKVKERESYAHKLDSLRRQVDSILVKIMPQDSIKYAKMDSTESLLFFQWYKDLNKDVSLAHTTDILFQMLNTSDKNTKKNHLVISNRINDNSSWADKRWLIAKEKIEAKPKK